MSEPSPLQQMLEAEMSTMTADRGYMIQGGPRLAALRAQRDALIAYTIAVYNIADRAISLVGAMGNTAGGLNLREELNALDSGYKWYQPVTIPPPYTEPSSPDD